MAKPLTENSKMHLQPAAVRPTKIILRLLAANLSTTANELSAASVLIQQNQHGDCKQNDMASFANQRRGVVQGADEVGKESFVSVDF